MRRILWLAVVSAAGVVLALSCGDGPAGDGDADADCDLGFEVSCDDDPPGDGAEVVFIIDTLRIADDEDRGFNLDCVDTPAQCDDEFCHSGQDDGHDGVDNQLGRILADLSDADPGFDMAGAIAHALENGTLLLLVRLVDIDDWGDDSCVSTYFYGGRDSSAPPAIVADRTYDIDARSLTGAENDIDAPVNTFEQASGIFGGVFHGGLRPFSVTLPVTSTYDAEFHITGTRLRWQASETEVADGLVGGFVTVHDLLGSLRGADGMSSIVYDDVTAIGAFAAIMEHQTDIDHFQEGEEIPGTRCTDDNVDTYDVEGNGCGSRVYTCSAAGHCVEPAYHYDAISVALEFTAIPARLGEIWEPPAADGDADSDADVDGDGGADGDPDLDSDSDVGSDA